VNKWVGSFSSWVDKISRYLMALCMGIAFLATVYQVFSRYVLMSTFVTGLFHGHSLSFLNFPWMEELVRYLFVWSVFIGIGVVYRLRGHAKVEIVTNFLPKFLKRWFGLAIEILNSLFFVILFVKGYEMLQITNGQLSPSLQINMSLMYVSILTCSVICFIHSVAFMTRILNWDNQYQLEEAGNVDDSKSDVAEIIG
jgi:TRAP-type transport system small permease protein